MRIFILAQGIVWMGLTIFLFLGLSPEKTQGNIHKLFYFHVAAAWTAFTGFFLSFIHSGWVFFRHKDLPTLRSGYQKIHRFNLVSVVFTLMALLTGMFWAKAVWGVFWNWQDARLVTFSLMLGSYLVFFLLGKSIPQGEDRYKTGHLWNLLAFANIPLVYFSVKIWNSSIHPIVAKSGSSMDMNMAGVLMGSVVMHHSLYFLFYHFLRITENPHEN